MNQRITRGKPVLKWVLSAAAASAALTAQTAWAAVVTVDFTGNPLSTVPYNIDGVYLNVVTGATGTANFAGYDVNAYFSGSGTAAALFRFLTPTTGGSIAAAGIATPLAPGAVVGPASTFAAGVVNANSATAGLKYFGIKFVNEGTGATNYGYLLVEQTANPPVAASVRILAYAYDNAGVAITVPLPPDPVFADGFEPPP
jgi:hypothetical protein